MRVSRAILFPFSSASSSLGSIPSWLGFLAFLAVRWNVHAAQQLPRRPEPLADTVFLQEVGRKIPSREPITSVIAVAGNVFAGSSKGIAYLAGNGLASVTGMSMPIQRLVSEGTNAWALSSSGLFKFDGTLWQKVSAQSLVDLTQHQGETIVASKRKLWRLKNGVLDPLATNEAPFEIQRLFSHCETLTVVGPGRVSFFERGRFGGRDLYNFPADLGWDWGDLPSPVTRDAASLGSTLYVATDRGLGVLRGMVLTTLNGNRGLPFEDTTCVATGFTNDLWIGTTRGAIRMVGESFHYFSGDRWLPNERVHAIAAGPQSVYIATENGLGIIDYEPFTLAKKAAYYERHLDEWGQKRLGLTHKLEWDDTLKEFVREISDNDGGYTGDYLAAQCYRFAVTQDPEARREAVSTFHAIRWLEAMTGIPGLPARSVWAKGERGHKAMHGSGGFAAEWHDTADGKFEWKGDTSSDELCSHFYSVGLFFEHVAQGEEIEQAKSLLARIATHLIDHQWKLVDLDGKPTRWGRWDPEYFLTDEGRFDRGLQSLEILSFMKMAFAMTADSKFADAYKQLVDLGYAEYTLRQRQVFPPDSILHFEDQLAFWCWWNLLRHEQDPELRSLYRRGFERSYEVVRVEKNPWYNFLYGTLTGNECDAHAAVAHLRDWPLDLTVWSYQNAHRTDLKTPAGYVALKGGTRAFPAREQEPLRWDAWTMKANGGSAGRDIIEPGGWLLAYWMGRFHGFIQAPAVKEPALLNVIHTYGRERGARPYDGPPRPDGF